MRIDYIITTCQNLRMGFLYVDGTMKEAHPFLSGSHLGNIYTASVVKVIPSIGAAFLDAGTGDTLYYDIRESEGKELYIRHGKKNHPCAGDTMIVQITRDPIRNKKASCSSNLTMSGEYVVFDRSGKTGISRKIRDEKIRENLRRASETSEFWGNQALPAGTGLIFRTASGSAPLTEIRREAESLLTEMKSVVDHGSHSAPGICLYENPAVRHPEFQKVRELLIRKPEDAVLTVYTGIPEIAQSLKKEFVSELSKESFSLKEGDPDTLDMTFRINTSLQKMLYRKIYLKSGGFLVVDETEAMTVIDVNTGKFTTGSSKEAHVLKTNLEAAQKIADVLRIRNLSGIILIDFINMTDADSRKKLISVLKESLSEDPVSTVFVDFTALGLAELTRRKVSKPLTELLYVREKPTESV